MADWKLEFLLCRKFGLFLHLLLIRTKERKHSIEGEVQQKSIEKCQKSFSSSQSLIESVVQETLHLHFFWRSCSAAGLYPNHDYGHPTAFPKSQ